LEVNQTPTQPEKEGKMTNTIEKHKLVTWLVKRWMILAMIVAVIGAIAFFVYATESYEAKMRDAQEMRFGAALAMNFARSHFSALDSDGNGTIAPEELEAATKRTWPNEDQAAVEAALGYLTAYGRLIGHHMTSDPQSPIEGINRDDLNSWHDRMAQYQ
jgi:hypothetical protein